MFICLRAYNFPAFPGGSASKEYSCNVGDLGSIPGLERSPEEGHVNPLLYTCLDNPHGQRSLVGNSPWGHKESDMTEQLSPSREKEYSGNCYKANLTGTKKVGCVPLMDDLKC